MDLQSTFALGDTAWAIDYETRRPRRLTIGQVRVEVNAEERTEEYMCHETGVGSGGVYRISPEDQTIWKTREECEAANAALIAEEKRKAEDLAVRQAAWDAAAAKLSPEEMRTLNVSGYSRPRF